MFDAFFNAIAWLLAWFYELPVVGESYGMAITLLTLTIMILVTPLNVKATRSMMTMSAMAPEMKRIQQEFADDRQRMNEELLAFYRENKINPVGGCLPMLLQIPFFIVLYQVIYGLTRRASEVMVAANGETVQAGEFIPKYLDQLPDSQLYGDLVGSTTMDSLWIDLSRSAATALQDSFGAGLPYIAMILAVAGTAFLQQKQMSMRNPNAEMPSQQKMLLRIMPVFFAFISFNFAAGLVVYFLVSNLYRIFQNAVISRHLYDLDWLPALLGVGEASLPASTGTTPPAASPKPGKAATDKPSKSAPDKPAKAATDKPGRATPPRDGSRSNGGGRAGGGRGKGSGTGSDKSTPSRPPSGRVTPPKNGGSGAQAPRRRKKKRT
jgi:YidC/Oxa1 family membrane protein insertase